MYTVVDSPIGQLTVVGADDGLTGLYYPHHWTRPDPERFGTKVEHGFERTRQQLAEYFAGERTEFDLPVHLGGNDEFALAVLAKVAAIPYGQTTTYGEIAAELGDRTRARDVGAAVGRNPVCLVLPCHRVLGKDGALTGYAGGLKRKQFLLELERPPAEERGQLW